VLATATFAGQYSPTPQGDTANHVQLLSDQDVAAVNLELQSAVNSNEAEPMDRVLHPQYALVLGD
jgi:hypothetical protein